MIYSIIIIQIRTDQSFIHLIKSFNVDNPKIILRGKTTESSHKSSICPDIPSEPLALFGFNLRMSETIFSLSKGI